MFGIAGAGVPRIVVPRELFAAAEDAPGVCLAGVPRIVVFCAGGVAAGWELGAGRGGVIIPGAVSIRGGVAAGLLGEDGGTAELDDGVEPAVDCACAAALANAKATAIVR
jgi:hypothetical protein